MKIEESDPHPDPDPLVRGMDPRIRIHTKMSWIRNTDNISSMDTTQVNIIGSLSHYSYKVHIYVWSPLSNYTC
jgi:hypothetical protein